nr:hypothetical protein GCM10025699_62720 [Microbacterium flavescens]
MSIAVTDLRIEHGGEALGLGTPRPRLSWRLAGPSGWRQASAEIALDTASGATETVVLDTTDQVLVDWPFADLGSRERVEVRVRVTGLDGSVSPWSRPEPVETGLLLASDWQARPVGGAWAEEPGTDRRPSRVRRGFRLDAPVVSARLYATAHGVFEAEVNGVRVGDDELSPGWTSYDARLRYRTYDVTELLVAGDNVVGAWLGDGWYRGRLGFNGGYHDLYGTDLSFLAQLEVELADGRRVVVATDDRWEAQPSPIAFSGLYDGERHDLRLDGDGWSIAGADDDGWTPVALAERDPSTLVAPEQPPVRCTEEVAPVAHRTTPRGTVVLDFGQNLVGRLRITVDGDTGHEITLHHAEVLQDGELYRRTLRLAAAEDVVILRGDGPTTWEPRFTVHGFRYAEITGWPGEFDPSAVVARVLHTDMERTGWFTSSDPGLNRLHENVLWSTRGTSSTSPPTARSATSVWAGRVTSRCSRPPPPSCSTARGCSAPGCRTSRSTSCPTAPCRGSCRGSPAARRGSRSSRARSGATRPCSRPGPSGSVSATPACWPGSGVPRRPGSTSSCREPERTGSGTRASSSATGSTRRPRRTTRPTR